MIFLELGNDFDTLIVVLALQSKIEPFVFENYPACLLWLYSCHYNTLRVLQFLVKTCFARFFDSVRRKYVQNLLRAIVYQRVQEENAEWTLLVSELYFEAAVDILDNY